MCHKREMSRLDDVRRLACPSVKATPQNYDRSMQRRVLSARPYFARLINSEGVLAIVCEHDFPDSVRERVSRHKEEPILDAKAQEVEIICFIKYHTSYYTIEHPKSNKHPELTEVIESCKTLRLLSGLLSIGTAAESQIAVEQLLHPPKRWHPVGDLKHISHCSSEAASLQ